MKAIIYLIISIFLLSLFFLSSKIYQHFPINYILERIPEADKYVHAFIFFVFVLVIDFFLDIFAPFWLTFLILTLLGFSIELIQFFIGRTFDWYDVLADVTGIALGLFYIYFKRVYIIM